jgi:hypothetical protein
MGTTGRIDFGHQLLNRPLFFDLGLEKNVTVGLLHVAVEIGHRPTILGSHIGQVGRERLP